MLLCIKYLKLLWQQNLRINQQKINIYQVYSQRPYNLKNRYFSSINNINNVATYKLTYKKHIPTQHTVKRLYIQSVYTFYKYTK